MKVLKSFTIEYSLALKLEEYARKTNKKMSQIIEEALIQYFSTKNTCILEKPLNIKAKYSKTIIIGKEKAVSDISQKIIDYLRQVSSASPSEIAKNTGIKGAVVRVYCSRLAKKGLIKKIGKGKYSIS
mgnify:CR=1 FL=1